MRCRGCWLPWRPVHGREHEREHVGSEEAGFAMVAEDFQQCHQQLRVHARGCVPAQNLGPPGLGRSREGLRLPATPSQPSPLPRQRWRYPSVAASCAQARPCRPAAAARRAGAVRREWKVGVRSQRSGASQPSPVCGNSAHLVGRPGQRRWGHLPSLHAYPALVVLVPRRAHWGSHALLPLPAAYRGQREGAAAAAAAAGRLGEGASLRLPPCHLLHPPRDRCVTSVDEWCSRAAAARLYMLVVGCCAQKLESVALHGACGDRGFTGVGRRIGGRIHSTPGAMNAQQGMAWLEKPTTQP